MSFHRPDRWLPLIFALGCFDAPQLAVAQFGEQIAANLPKPNATPSVTKFPKVLPWPEGKTPQAPQGLKVTAFVRDLENPRWLYVLPNGDVLVAQSRTMPQPPEKNGGDSNDEDPKQAEEKKKIEEGMKQSKTVTGDSPNIITLLRDADGDGEPEVRETLLEGLNQPLGMALVGDRLFVANTDALMSFPYKTGDTKISDKGMKILDLPAGGYNNHWTRNVIANADGSKLYISVGSGSNVAEHGTANEMLRACVLECNLDGTALRVFASGLRNPVGLAWNAAATTELWTAVNERDELGDELVPDYITSVQDGGFYGWPFAYFGQHEDPRLAGQRPDLVKKTIAPDVPTGAHTASLGLAFYNLEAGPQALPEKYRGGAFVGQRGSWNRSQFAGYKVVFVPFELGKSSGLPQDFLTGFIANDNEVYGRPVGVAFMIDGSLLVADEPSNIVWRVSAE
jgi:glucose/arabinose dehydrogenase